MHEYKVSVLIVNYNHADTLQRAIESVLMQKTVYTVQVIVVDDCSTDGSVEALKQYYEAGKVSVISFAEHYGLMTAYRVGLERCRGEYIAFCDSDDYWTAEDKLQRQIEVMDEFPLLSLCVTKVHTCLGGEFTDMPTASYVNEHLTYDNLLRGNAYIHAQSYLLRKYALDKYIDFNQFISLGFHVWDYPIVLELSQHSKFLCLDFYSAVFNKQPESVTQTHSRIKRLRYIWGNFRIRAYYIHKYGCKTSTLHFVLYKLLRDLLSTLLKRWK